MDTSKIEEVNMRFIYTRISNLLLKIDALKATGCDEIITDEAAVKNTSRPGLTNLLNNSCFMLTNDGMKNYSKNNYNQNIVLFGFLILIYTYGGIHFQLFL